MQKKVPPNVLPPRGCNSDILSQTLPRARKTACFGGAFFADSQSECKKKRPQKRGRFGICIKTFLLFAFRQILVLSPTRVHKLLGVCVEFGGALRIEHLKHLEAVFNLHVFNYRNLRIFGIQLERILARGNLARIVSVKRPVS